MLIRCCDCEYCTPYKKGKQEGFYCDASERNSGLPDIDGVFNCRDASLKEDLEDYILDAYNIFEKKLKILTKELKSNLENPLF